MRKAIFTDLLQAENKIETLRLMPHKIEGGIVYDFNGEAMFNVSNDDIHIMDTDVIKSRYTPALEKKYLSCLDKVIFDVTGGTTAINVSDEPTLEQELIRYISEGDKKAVRSICKKLKDQWFALDSDDVEDAIDDIKDCVADRDTKTVKEVLSSLDDDVSQGIPVAVESEPVTKAQVVADIKEKRANVKSQSTISETTKEILEDLDTAIDEKDTDDIKELLSELADEVGEDSDLYKKYAGTNVEESKDEDTTEADEITLDLEDAIKEGDMDEAKEILKELADEVGEDSDLYKEWAAKVAPEKRSRRERRGK